VDKRASNAYTKNFQSAAEMDYIEIERIWTTGKITGKLERAQSMSLTESQ
jgi:hypothetical protein